MKVVFLIIVFASIQTSVISQNTLIKYVSENAKEINLYEKFELTIDIISSWKNPYDYNEMNLQCVVVSPKNVKDTIDAFYMQPYKVEKGANVSKAFGKPVYKIRFSPTLTGTWKYYLIFKNDREIKQSTISEFTCVNNSNGKGFIRKGTSNYLQFDNGNQFIPIGENANCPAENIFTDYTIWMKKLVANMANLMNVWMIHEGFGIEWTGYKNKNFAGLKYYNQQNAFNLDWLLQQCEASEMYLLLGLNTCGGINSTVNPPWSENPYNKINGGPCITQGEFFTNYEAKSLIKNRLRYIIARYGYSRNIMSWNLFIEVDGIAEYKKYKKDVTQWHKEMSAYIKRNDLNNHLITTSYSSDIENDATWKLPLIDFTQTHNYVNSAQPEKRIVGANRMYLNKFKKPTFTAEFGLDPNITNVSALDPNGVYLHNVLWSSGLGGAMGPALTYWWSNYIEPQNLYYHFKPISSFLNNLLLVKEHYAPVSVTLKTQSTEVSIKPSAGWSANTDTTFKIDNLGNIEPTADQLGVYLYGKALNTQWRKPVNFLVNFLVDGYFTVKVGEATLYPLLTVTIDNKKYNRSVVPNGVYQFPIPKGNHTIKLENSGSDWLYVNEYLFSDAGAILNPYVLKNELNNKVAGYILNQNYNWKARYDKLRLIAYTAELSVPGLQKGNYTVTFYNPSTLQKIDSYKITLKEDELKIQLPNIIWDIAFTIEKV